MSRLQNITALILNKRDFMESDLMLLVLDQEGLRRELCVKGAGSGKSKRRAHLERMNLIKGSVYEGKRHLYLQDVECQESFTQLKSNYDKIVEASTLLELCERSVMEADPHPEIFDLLLESFRSMNNKNVQNHVLDVALIQLAHALGFLPSFRNCSHCHQDTAESFSWDYQNGTLDCTHCRPQKQILPLKYRKALEYFKTQSLTQALALKLSSEEHNQLRNLSLRLFEAHLHKPLKSLALHI